MPRSPTLNIMDPTYFAIGGKYGFKDGYKIVIPPQYEAAGSFHNGLAIVMLNRKFGAINSKGDFVIPNRYDDLRHLYGTYFAARINITQDEWKCGIIDIDNNIIVQFVYKCIESRDDSFFLCYKEALSQLEGIRYLSLQGKYSYRSQNKCDWYNSNGCFITSSEVVNRSKNYLIFKNQHDKYGAVRADRVIIIPSEYDTLEYCDGNTFLATHERDGLITSLIVDDSGKVLFSTLQDIVFRDGFFLTGGVNENKWVSIDGNVAYVGDAIPLSSEYLKINKNKKFGIIDKNGNKLINFLYDDILFAGSFFIVRREEYIGLVGLKGEVIIDAIYKNIENICIENNPLFLGSKETLAIASCISGTTYQGYCQEYHFDTKGHQNSAGQTCDLLNRAIIRIESHYDYHQNERVYTIRVSKNIDLDKPFIVRTNSYCELYTAEDGIISNSRFQEIQQLTKVCYVVKKDNKYGVFRIDIAEVIIPIEYDQIQFFGGHTVLLRKGDLWGAKSLVIKKHILHNLMQVDIPCEAREIKILDKSQLHFGVKKVYTDYSGNEVTYYTILNNVGKEVDELRKFQLEEQFTFFDENHYLTKMNGKYGFVSILGYTSIPFIYDEIKQRATIGFNVRIGNAWGVIDLSGKELVRVKYTEPIPLYIASPKDAFFCSNSLNDDSNYASDQYKNRIIVSDALSGYFGCLDIDGNEVIPTVYEHLQFCSDTDGDSDDFSDKFLSFGYGGMTHSESSTFFSEIIYGTWGCINSEGRIIIPAKYDCIQVAKKFILAGRDGGFIGESDSYDDKYDGVFDLYNHDGELLFGGFREFLYDSENKVFAFFFGGEWERYCSYEDDWNGIRCYSYQFKRNNDLWLLVDDEFKTIVRKDDNDQYSFGKGFIGNVEIRKEESKIRHIYNMPISLMSKGFHSFSLNCAFVKESNSEDAKIAVLDYSSGIQTPFYESIYQVNENIFFISEGKKVGIRTLMGIIIPCEYLFFTKPENGYFFGAKEMDEHNSSLSLFHISNAHEPICVVIQSRATDSIISDLGFNRLKLYFKRGVELTDASVIEKNIFSPEFQKLIMDEPNHSFIKKWSDQYYFAYDDRIGPQDCHNNWCDDIEDRDYMRESWDAMTDGMYGDMPDSFNGDFDFLGR